MLLFKTNYSYKLKILLTPQQAKKMSKTAKERMEKLIQLYRNLHESVKLIQECIKKNTIIKKYLRDQILKREIKFTYLLKILRVSNLAKS